MHEYLEAHPDTRIRFTCVESDERAIAHATRLIGERMDRVTFHQANVLRYRARQPFDLVWSAGLFDYFEDGIFRRLLARFPAMLAEGGEIAIGNFSPDNPSRPYMELFGEWFLKHRSEAHLVDLALAAGLSREAVAIGSEPERVNLFLHATGGRSAPRLIPRGATPPVAPPPTEPRKVQA